MQEERDELRKELLGTKAPELGILENSQSIQIGKKNLRKFVLKRILRMWLNHHLIKKSWVWLMDMINMSAEARNRGGTAPAWTPASLNRSEQKSRTEWRNAVRLLGFYRMEP